MFKSEAFFWLEYLAYPMSVRVDGTPLGFSLTSLENLQTERRQHNMFKSQASFWLESLDYHMSVRMDGTPLGFLGTSLETSP